MSSSPSSTADATSTSPYFTTAFPSSSGALGSTSTDGTNTNTNNSGITASSSLYLRCWSPEHSPSFAVCEIARPPLTKHQSPNLPISTTDHTMPSSFFANSFTFLATLLLLLAVSCAIVVRSLVLRRRFRRRVQEALANGIILPPPPGGLAGAMGFGAAARGPRRDFGEKPTLWDRWLAPPHEPADEKAGAGRWHDLMPVSAKVLSDTLSGNGQPLPAPAAPRAARPSVLRSLSGAGAGAGADLRRWPFFFSAAAFPPTRPAPSDAPAVRPPSPPAHAHAGADAQLQLAVLIAMPSRFRPRAWDPQRPAPLKPPRPSGVSVRSSSSSSSTHEGEDDLPEVVFGVTEVPWMVSPSSATPPSPGAQSAQQGAERAQS